MMQMFKYPQGEGGHALLRPECQTALSCCDVLSPFLLFSPLPGRCVIRLTSRHVTVSMGGQVYGD